MDFLKEKLIVFLSAVLAIFLAILAVWLIVGIQNKVKEGNYIGQDVESKNTITVSDKGEVYAKPDLALIVFSVQNEAKTVSQAMADNTKKMNAVMKAVKDNGVEEKDLKTINFNIYPRYEYQKATEIFPSGQRVLVGYEVSQSLQAKVRNLEKVGELIEKATAVGANQVGDLQFTIDQPDEFKKQAREEAIQKAKTKAQELAQELGVKLVRISGFNETSQLPYWLETDAIRGYGIGGGGDAAPQIATGENKIEVSVIITYEIK